MNVKSKNKPVHVVPSDGGWKVVRTNASRATAKYDNKSDAMHRASNLAKSSNSVLVEHRKDGRITKTKAFGKKK